MSDCKIGRAMIMANSKKGLFNLLSISDPSEECCSSSIYPSFDIYIMAQETAPKNTDQ